MELFYSEWVPPLTLTLLTIARDNPPAPPRPAILPAASHGLLLLLLLPNPVEGTESPPELRTQSEPAAPPEIVLGPTPSCGRLPTPMKALLLLLLGPAPICEGW